MVRAKFLNVFDLYYHLPLLLKTRVVHLMLVFETVSESIAFGM